MADILIIEDGLHERTRLEKLLQSASFSVRAAESAEAAEKLLDVEQFRLAILDIGLADKSGSYLFEIMKKTKKVSFVIILTGNPSIHLKQRFLDEGAAAFIVKASPASENEALLATVQSFLGTADVETVRGIPLEKFLRSYVSEQSKELFLDTGNEVAACSNCGSADFVVTFSHKTQLPPVVEGKVVCSKCSSEMDDPEVG